MMFAKKKRLILIGWGVIILILCIFSLIKNWIINLNTTADRNHPAYILEEKYYTSIEEAGNEIKDIPFIVPQTLISGNRLKEIIYTKDRDNSCKLSINYLNENNNEIYIEYFSIGDTDEMYSPIMSVNPNIIRVETNLGMDSTQKNTNTSGKTIIRNKLVSVNLPNYHINIAINYTGAAYEADHTEDEILLNITEFYLQSELFNAKTEDEIIFDSQTIKYNSFEELQKNIPDNISITEPKYIPKGLNLKYVFGKYYKKDPSKCFNITATYEDSEGTVLTLSYKTSGESGVHKNNDNIMKQSNVYRIQCNNDGKGYLVPYIEKYLPIKAHSFDLHICFLYKAENSYQSEKYGKEIKKILEGIME